MDSQVYTLLLSFSYISSVISNQYLHT
uniref:Uncharacterized protein n=1 Tax=Arundo donax TaxID=35708 RepID=A0A0A9F586_ARUDO